MACKIYVGLDCGGSSTRLLAEDAEGQVLFRGFAGPANLTSTPEDKIQASLQAAADGCPQPDYVCGGFAGLLGEQDRTLALDLLQVIFPTAHVRAEPDFAAALYSCPPETDVCVVSGTGSLVCSLFQGRLVKSGGRGFLLGDEGSSAQMGRDTLKMYLDDPKAAPRLVKQAVRELFDDAEESEIVSRVYKASSIPALLSKLSKPLALEAQRGDERCINIARKNLNSLSSVIMDHVRKYPIGKPNIKLGLAGGLWKTARIYREVLLGELSAFANCQVHAEHCKRPPVEGAVALAKELEIGN